MHPLHRPERSPVASAGGGAPREERTNKAATARAALDAIRAALDRLDRAAQQHRRNGQEPDWDGPRDLAYLDMGAVVGTIALS